MLKFLSIIAAALICSCNSIKTDVDDLSGSILKGKWTVYQFYGADCNACTDVYFDSGKTGRMVEPSGERREFSFMLSKTKIAFSFNDSGDFYGESEFEYELYPSDDQWSTLKLTTVDGTNQIILAGDRSGSAAGSAP